MLRRAYVRKVLISEGGLYFRGVYTGEFTVVLLWGNTLIVSHNFIFSCMNYSKDIIVLDYIAAHNFNARGAVYSNILV